MEKPDVLGEQRKEADEPAKGTGTVAAPQRVERRWMRSKRWYDKMSLQQMEGKIRDIVRRMTR